MADRRLPGARAKAGRSLATLRPPPDRPAGIVLTNGQGDQEQPPPAQPEPPPPSVKQTTEQVRGEAVSDDPEQARPAAATTTAASEAMAMPLLAQVGRSLLVSKRINPRLLARQQRRQHLTLRALQEAVEALGPGGSISQVHEQLDSYSDYERLRQAALACYRLAADSFQVTRALFTPILEAEGELSAIGVTRSGGTAELTAGQTPDPDPWAAQVQVVDVRPDSASGQHLVQAGRAAIRQAEDTPREVPAMVVTETDDLRVVAERRVPALAGAGAPAEAEPEEPEPTP